MATKPVTDAPAATDAPVKESRSVVNATVTQSVRDRLEDLRWSQRKNLSQVVNDAIAFYLDSLDAEGK